MQLPQILFKISLSPPLLRSPIIMQVPQNLFQIIPSVTFWLEIPIMMQIPQNFFQAIPSTSFFAEKSNHDAAPSKLLPNYPFYLLLCLKVQSWCSSLKISFKLSLLPPSLLESPIMMQLPQNSFKLSLLLLFCFKVQSWCTSLKTSLKLSFLPPSLL